MVKRALCLGLCILFLFPAVGLGVETNPLVQGYLEGYLLGITPAQEGEKPVSFQSRDGKRGKYLSLFGQRKRDAVSDMTNEGNESLQFQQFFFRV